MAVKYGSTFLQLIWKKLEFLRENVLEHVLPSIDHQTVAIGNMLQIEYYYITQLQFVELTIS